MAARIVSWLRKWSFRVLDLFGGASPTRARTLPADEAFSIWLGDLELQNRAAIHRKIKERYRNL